MLPEKPCWLTQQGPVASTRQQSAPVQQAYQRSKQNRGEAPYLVMGAGQV